MAQTHCCEQFEPTCRNDDCSLWRASTKSGGNARGCRIAAMGGRPESGWADDCNGKPTRKRLGGGRGRFCLPPPPWQNSHKLTGTHRAHGGLTEIPKHSKNKGRAGTIRQCSCVDSMEMLGCLEHSACSAHACMVTMGTQGLTQTHRDPQRLTGRHRAAQRLTGRQRLTWRQGFSGSNNAVGSQGQEF